MIDLSKIDLSSISKLEKEIKPDGTVRFNVPNEDLLVLKDMTPLQILAFGAITGGQMSSEQLAELIAGGAPSVNMPPPEVVTSTSQTIQKEYPFELFG